MSTTKNLKVKYSKSNIQLYKSSSSYLATKIYQKLLQSSQYQCNIPGFKALENSSKDLKDYMKNIEKEFLRKNMIITQLRLVVTFNTRYMEQRDYINEYFEKNVFFNIKSIRCYKTNHINLERRPQHQNTGNYYKNIFSYSYISLVI